MAAYVLIGFLAILFILNVIINAPLEKPINIGQSGQAGLFLDGHKWYSLSAEDYSVDAETGETHIRCSFLPIFSRRYTYYRVTVHPGTENAFSMTVRVTDAKREYIIKGIAVDLYGMVSDYETRGVGSESLSGEQTELLSRCLNDNGQSAFKRWATASVFAIAAGLCIWLIIKIAEKK